MPRQVTAAAIWQRTLWRLKRSARAAKSFKTAAVTRNTKKTPPNTAKKIPNVRGSG
jgi:hypothetical protein